MFTSLRIPLLLAILAASPAVRAARVMVARWTNIPIWDEWDTPGMALLRHAQHALTWADLFSQHNESRKVFPRLIHIAIASFAGWDVRQGMVLTFLCACAASVLALLLLRRQAGTLTGPVLLAWFLMNALLFAPSQYENFLSGFVFEIFIPFLCLFGCIFVNSSEKTLPIKTTINASLAFFATYTFAHGMLLWPLLLPLHGLPAQRTTKANQWLCYGGYVLAGIVSVGFYFIGYTRPEVAPPPASLRQLPQVLEFMAVWLGAVVRSPSVDARVAGVIVAVILSGVLVCTGLFLAQNRDRWKAYYPWLLLASFALGSGALTAIGRVNLGVDTAFNIRFEGFSSMRYNVTSIFAYVALIGLVLNLFSETGWRNPAAKNRLAHLTTLGTTLLGVAWMHMAAEEETRVRGFQHNRARALAAVTWIDVLPENPEIFEAYPYPEGFWKRVAEMKRLELVKTPAVGEQIKAAIASTPSTDGNPGGYLDGAEQRARQWVRFSGWARNADSNTASDFAVLGWEGTDGVFHPFTALITGRSRPDLMERFDARGLKRAGFNEEVDISKLPAGPLTIKGWSVDLIRNAAFPLGGEVRVLR